MAKKQEPGRMNDVWDHSVKTLFEASGMTESQFNTTTRMVDKTCCSREMKYSETLEHWCDVLSKKEMAMLIRMYRHKAIFSHEKNSFSLFEKFFGEKEKPTKENDIYDLTKIEDKDLKKVLGFDEHDISKLIDKLNMEIQKKGSGNSVHLAQIIQKHTTHKELSLLYALEMTKKMHQGDISSFISKLFGDGKEE